MSVNKEYKPLIKVIPSICVSQIVDELHFPYIKVVMIMRNEKNKIKGKIK